MYTSYDEYIINDFKSFWIRNIDDKDTEVLNNIDILYCKDKFVKLMSTDLKYLGNNVFKKYIKYWIKKDENLLFLLLNNNKIDMDFSYIMGGINNIDDLKRMLFYTNYVQKRNFLLSKEDMIECFNINKNIIYNLNKNELFSFFKNDCYNNFDFFSKDIIIIMKELGILNEKYFLCRFISIFNNNIINNNVINIIKERNDELFNLFLPYEKNKYINLRKCSISARWEELKILLIKNNIDNIEIIFAMMSNLLNQKDNKWDVDIIKLTNDMTLFINDFQKNIHILDYIDIYSKKLLEQIKKIIFNGSLEKISHEIKLLYDINFLLEKIIWSAVYNDINFCTQILDICNYKNYNLSHIISTYKLYNVYEEAEYYINRIIFGEGDINIIKWDKLNLNIMIKKLLLLSADDLDDDFLNKKYTKLLTKSLNNLSSEEILNYLEKDRDLYFLLDDENLNNKKIKIFAKKNKLLPNLFLSVLSNIFK